MTTEIGSSLGIEYRRQIAGGLFFIDDELEAAFRDQFERFDDQVIERATEACKLNGWTVSGHVETLAAAYAEAGDFDSAINYQNKAIELTPNDAEFVKEMKERLKLYGEKKPYRDE